MRRSRLDSSNFRFELLGREIDEPNTLWLLWSSLLGRPRNKQYENRLPSKKETEHLRRLAAEIQRHGANPITWLLAQIIYWEKPIDRASCPIAWLYNDRAVNNWRSLVGSRKRRVQKDSLQTRVAKAILSLDINTVEIPRERVNDPLLADLISCAASVPKWRFLLSKFDNFKYRTIDTDTADRAIQFAAARYSRVRMLIKSRQTW